MPTNRRTFFAVKEVDVLPDGVATVTASHSVHGLQSAGLTLNFNLVQVFEIAQLEIYENIEDIPDVQVTLEKFLDGYAPIYCLATKGASAATLAGRSTAKCGVLMSIFDDTQSAASGSPINKTFMSGMFCQSIGWKAEVGGQASESVTLVGNNKTVDTATGITFTGKFTTNADTPLSLAGASGGVQRREDLLFVPITGAGFNSTVYTILPPDIPGISSSGTNDLDSNGNFGASIQSVSVSANLGREPMYEMGRRAPYFRYLSFPIEVKTDIEINAKKADTTQATELGINSDGTNLSARQIRLVWREGTKLDLGSSNKLQNVSWGGEDATQNSKGTQTYSFVTFNNLTVTHPQDPSGFTQ